MRTENIRGTTVPALGFGTFQLKGDDCERGVRHALDVGYRHIDTAQGYRNEDRVGAALASRAVERGDVFLTTKLDNDEGKVPDRVLPARSRRGLRRRDAHGDRRGARRRWRWPGW